jgi:ketosteroid isomerase-like protein
VSAVPDEAVREVLVANDAFYAAFSAADLALMDALWAREHSVTCTHPGRAVLESREAVMASWHLIFRSGQRLRAAADGASVCLSGAMAVVTCYERLRNARGQQLGVLAATNVFVREGEDWKLVHHHASGLATDENDDDGADDEPTDGGKTGGMVN